MILCFCDLISHTNIYWFIPFIKALVIVSTPAMQILVMLSWLSEIWKVHHFNLPVYFIRVFCILNGLCMFNFQRRCWKKAYCFSQDTTVFNICNFNYVWLWREQKGKGGGENLNCMAKCLIREEFEPITQNKKTLNTDSHYTVLRRAYTFRFRSW